VSARDPSLLECERCGHRGRDCAPLPPLAAGMRVRDADANAPWRPFIACARCSKMILGRRAETDAALARAAELARAVRPFVPADSWAVNVANAWSTSAREDVTLEGARASIARCKGFGLQLGDEVIDAAAAALYEATQRVCQPRDDGQGKEASDG
jgi:hypothetical protein